MMSEDSYEYAEMRERITQLEAKVKYQDEVIEQRNVMCIRAETERDALAAQVARLREALKRSKQGYLNILELGLIAENQMPDAQRLVDQANAALANTDPTAHVKAIQGELLMQIKREVLLPEEAEWVDDFAALNDIPIKDGK